MQSVQKYTEVIRCSWTFSLLRFMLWNSEQHQKWDYLIRQQKREENTEERSSVKYILAFLSKHYAFQGCFLKKKKKKESYCNAIEHGILATSSMDTKQLPCNNQLSNLHGHQVLTYAQIADVDEESMIWCQNDHHGILIKFN